MPSISETDRRDALNMMATANQRMAEHVDPPVWYHLTLGLLVGGLIAVGEAPLVWTFAALPLYAVGLLVLARAKRNRMGVFINGYRRGRTRWVALAALALILVTFSLATFAETELHLWGAYLIAGAAVAVIVTATGRVWLWAYRRDLAADSA